MEWIILYSQFFFLLPDFLKVSSLSNCNLCFMYYTKPRADCTVSPLMVSVKACTHGIPASLFVALMQLALSNAKNVLS